MKQKIALVLSGGGARGIAHIGAIEELERQGYEIGAIAGTSMGALVGGTFALGKMEEFKTWLCGLDKIKVFNLVDFTFSSQGLIKGDKVLNTIKEFIPDKNIEDLKIPYVAVSADIIHKKEVVFTKGSIFEAIRASISIPTVFTPVKTADALLVDGGVVNNIPINHVKRMPDDFLVVVNVNADIPVQKLAVSKIENKEKHSIYQEKMQIFYDNFHKIYPANHDEKLGYFNLITKTIGLMTHHMDEIMLDQYSPDLLINVSHESCGTYDFYRAEELVEIGRYAAKKCLEEYKPENI
ncbi:MAG: patatin-like phospholipase family protein [Bacteroidales bacterium]|nr:patatin-like phospholipase family protein [Bacteroidales bacterium]MCF8457606.1 patatin-like phospholipase family protein [Bacteroidales bacterium]